MTSEIKFGRRAEDQRRKFGQRAEDRGQPARAQVLEETFVELHRWAHGRVEGEPTWSLGYQAAMAKVRDILTAKDVHLYQCCIDKDDINEELKGGF